MNQNETKPLTADQTLRKWCEYTYPSLSDAAKMALQTACLSYAAQQVKQVTEERDKAVKLLRTCLREFTVVNEIIEPLGHHGFVLTPNEIQDLLNSLNAGSEAGEK